MSAHDPAARARRLAIARAVGLLLFLGLAARAAHLSVFDERGVRLGERQSRTVLPLAPQRGAILDRDGHALALSVEAPSVYVRPGDLGDLDAASAALGRALGRRAGEVKRRLQGRRGFVYVARWVTPAQAERVRRLRLPGVGLVQEPRRSYPLKRTTARLVGFANIDGQGVRGIEQQEDAWLRGSSRHLRVERDGSGQLLVSRGGRDWRTAGGDVALTLDLAMQSAADEALREAVEASGARGGVVVTLDPANGELLALAEAPGFDPQAFRSVPYPSTRSRAFLDALEPGSTLKVFLVAAALENGTLGPRDRVDCGDGAFAIPGKTIRDHKPWGELSSADVLRVSSNIGAVKIAFDLGAAAHLEMLRRFGFGSVTGSGFPDESAGVLRDEPPRWPLDQATLAFGQGLSVTPVQLAAATASLANGGQWVKPRLVRARRVEGSPWRETQPERVRRAVAPETAAQLLSMLETVTGPDGTGRRAALRDVRVAGKTGTAQKFDAELGTYSQRRYVAWFLGVVPADAPRLVIVVALDEPRRPHHTGGAVAAPLFARVAAAQLARLGVLTEAAHPTAPSAPEVEPETRTAEAPVRAGAAAAAPRPLPEPERLADRVLLPDLRGLTVAEVKAVTARADLAVEISGSGRAVAQDPPPGTVVAGHAARIRVRFETGADSS